MIVNVSLHLLYLIFDRNRQNDRAEVTTVSLVVIFSGEVRGSDQPGEEHEVASVAA
jgi:hypothetical protein